MPKLSTVNEQVEDVLDTLKSTRSFRTVDRYDINHYDYDLTTNDYFGLSQYSEDIIMDIIQDDEDQDLREGLDIYYQMETPFGGSTGSRLVSGNTKHVKVFEQFVGSRMSKAAGKDKECLYFNSGYHANIGIIPALAKLNSSTLVIMDQLIHASIIDGVQLAGCNFKRFRHNDLEHLRSILDKAVERYENIIIVVESIYSMDGDGLESMRDLAIVKSDYSDQANIILYCDEAHACGLFGDYAFGRCEDEDALSAYDIIVCPMGKAFNAVGCMVFTSPLLKQYIVNTARSFIYSTALPPIDVEYAFLTYLACCTQEFREYSETLLDLSDKLRTLLIEAIMGLGYEEHIAEELVLGEYQITGLILGSNEAVLAARDFFVEEEIKVSAIRYPTVPKGEERIRLSLQCSNHLEDLNDADIIEIAKSFQKFIESDIAREAIANYIDKHFPDYDEEDEEEDYIEEADEE